MSTRGIKFQFSPDEFVLCFEPDPSKARVLYKAKILDTTVYRDLEGKRQPGYHIHFLRWNRSWDRVVSEELVLKNSEENRSLMKQLKEVARGVRRNKTRHKKISQILTEAFNGKATPFESGGEEESDEDVTSTNDTEEDETTGDESDSLLSDNKGEEHRKKTITPIELEIPDNLKIILDKDYFAINQEKKLVKLPAEINMVTVLESFVKTFMLDFWNPSFDRSHFCQTNPKIAIEKILPMCKEFVDGLRICFDFVLPLILLYPNEKDQYHSVTAAFKNKSPAKQKIPSEDSPLIQSPRSRSGVRSVGPVEEPSPKLPKLSPNIPSEEEDDEVSFLLHEKTTWRMTRRALHSHQAKEENNEEKEVKSEVVEKRELRSSPDRKNMDKKADKGESANRIRTRRGSERDGENMRKRALRKSRKSSDSSAESDRSQPDTILSEPAKSVSVKLDKTERPPPLLIPCNLMGTRQQSGKEKGTSGSTDSLGESGKEEILENILSWQMLTPEALGQLPTPPALLYGAHHLLRMFVKLPGLLSHMDMDEHKVGVLVKLLKQFVIYLSEHTIELFSEASYVPAGEALRSL